MKYTASSFILLSMILFSSPLLSQNTFKAPKTDARPVVDELHGVKITDNYQWLEDKEDAEVLKWTKEQHNTTEEYLENLPEIKGLKDEISAYIDRDIVGAPRLIGDRQFIYVKKKGEQQYKLYTLIDGKEVLIFDPLDIDPSGLSAISGVDYTLAGDRAAIGVQTKGAEIKTMYIIDTKTGEIQGDPIKGLRGFTWTKDEKHAYIAVGTKEMLEQQIPLKTYLHKIGSTRLKDKFLFQPKDSKDIMYTWDSDYSDYNFISQGDFYSNTLTMKKIGVGSKSTEIYSSKKFRSSVRAIDDELFILTNDNAPNFKLMKASVHQPESKNWKALIPEQEDMVLENYRITSDYIIIQGKKDVVSSLYAYTHQGKLVKEIPLPEVGNVQGVGLHRESNMLYVSLSTFTKPSRIYKLDGKSLRWELFFERESPLDTDNIEAKIEFYESKDGTKVPIFIMHKKGIKRDGTNPALLYGYGGFNIGMSPSYIGISSAFVNRGGVYAIACIRGGDEYGEQWHLDGMLQKKQNTFDDFIAGAEYLFEQGYSTNEKLAILGGSNGGLLVGAVATQRPDICHAVVCAVPLLDMVRYHKFLIARYWIPEYGDPEIKKEFGNILAYSPYHNISTTTSLPKMMIVAGENDTRVDPLHAKKFVAAAQNNPSQHNPVMLYVSFDSGHGSGKSTEQTITDLELRYRFIMHSLGMK